MTDSTTGGRIVEARMARRLTMEQLAHRLGVEPQTVANWESDRDEPSARQATRLSGILNVGLLWLLTGDAPPMAEDDGSAVPEFNETSALSAKVDRLMNIQAQAALLTNEILIDLSRLQRELDARDEAADGDIHSAA